MKSYQNTIKEEKRNAIFLCVINGNISEGIDLKDNLARLIFIIGIPYSAFKDPYVQNKREYLDKNFKTNMSNFLFYKIIKNI